MIRRARRGLVPRGQDGISVGHEGLRVDDASVVTHIEPATLALSAHDPLITTSGRVRASSRQRRDYAAPKLYSVWHSLNHQRS